MSTTPLPSLPSSPYLPSSPAFSLDDRPGLALALHEVLVAYARMCDERDWSAIGRVFAPGAQADYGGWKLPDVPAILRMLQRHLGGCGPTQHLLGNLTVEVRGEAVTSRVAVRAAHRGAGPRVHLHYDCMGDYLDRWAWTAEGWRIAHRQMVVALEFGTREVLGPAPA